MYPYKRETPKKTDIRVNESVEGYTIEQKVEMLIENNEPTDMGTPREYQERSAGVNPACDIRTDRFDIALEATGKVQKSYTTKREEARKAREATPESGTPEPTQAPVI